MHKGPARGFALVLALVLMTFILSLMLGLSLLVQLELRSGGIEQSRMEARKLAEMAVYEAIGELQKALGPDQRVSARAEILAEAMVSPRWIGAWDVTGDNLRDYEATAGTTDRGGPNGSIRAEPQWLVSQPAGMSFAPHEALPPEGSVRLQSASSPSRAVVVPTREIPDVGKLGWWIDDEGLKASLKTGDRLRELAGHVDSAALPLLRNLPLYSGRRIVLERQEGLEELDAAVSLEKFTRPDDLALIGLGRAVVLEREPDLTGCSMGVLADTANGGLRKDLSRGLEEQWHRLLAFVDEELSPDGAGPTVVNSGVDTRMADNYNVPTGQTGSAAPRIDYSAARDAAGDLIGWPRPQPLFWEEGPNGLMNGPSWDLLYDFYHQHKPFTPYTPIIDLDNWENPATVFLGYGSGKPPELMGDIRWWTVYGKQRRADGLGVSGIGVGRPAGLDDNRALFPVMPLRAGGPAYERLFVPGTADEAANAAEDFFRMGPFPETARREPLWNMVNPIQVKAQLTLGLQSILKTAPGDPDHPAYGLSLSFFPSVVLWNPYNVRMTTRELEIKVDFKDLRWQIFIDEDLNGFDSGDIYFDNDGGPETSHRTGSADPVNQGTYFGFGLSANFESEFTIAYGERFGFVARSVTLEPGEVRVLTLPETRPLRSFHIDGRNSDEPDRYFLTPEYNADHHATIDLEYTPVYGGVPWTNSTEGWVRNNYRRPVAYRSGGNVQVRFYPRSDSDADPREGQMLFETSQNIFTNDKKPILLQRSLVDFFTTARSIDIPPLDGGLSTGITKFATFSFNLQPTSEPGGGRLLLARNPRASNSMDFSGSGKGLSPLFKAELLERPSAGQTDIQIKPGTTGRSYFGPSFGPPSGESEIVLYSVPRQPPQSMGEFMHANLSLFPDLPNYAVGGSEKPDGFSGQDLFLVSGEGILVPDISFLLSDALLDRFFFSTVPPDWSAMPSVYDAYNLNDLMADIPPYVPLNKNALEQGLPLPNGRMRYLRKPDEPAEDYLPRLRDFDKAASALLLEGTFNVNSTSVEAWKAVLSGGSPESGDDSITIGLAENGGTASLSPEDLANAVSRFSEPMGLAGEAWSGFRALSENELDALAVSIVNEVRTRGPFASLSDFANRRLVNGSAGEKGALAAAIEAADLNAGIAESQAGRSDYLLQNDLLRMLLPYLSARSDTFRIRAMGETKDGHRSYAEALVQRIPEFVNPVDAPETVLDDLQLATNRDFGRRFIITDFRWLNEDEI